MGRSSRHRSRETPPRRAVARIAEIAAAGDGVAIVDGARIYAPLTAPGDVVEIDIRGGRGEVIALKEAGPHRAAAPCRHYGQCGGCSLQHVTRAFYRDWKRARVVDALAREGLGEAEVRPTLETPAASRRRATFAVRKLGDCAILGFNARRASEIVDLEDCLILDRNLADMLQALRALAATIDAGAFDLSVTQCENGLDAVAIGKIRTPEGRGRAALIEAARRAGIVRMTVNDEPIVAFAAPVVRFDGLAVTPPAGSFLQASREGEAALIGLVKEALAESRKIADLFSGCGAFALPLARTATVSAFDADRAAIAALATAAGAAQREGLNINPVKVEARDLFERPLSAKELKGFDALIFDPPRAGAEAQATAIAQSGVALVVGVSCNPKTFARDAVLLVSGGYRLSHVVPVDQFVYSAHVELVGIFRKG
ncbi:MAG: class I SAM-dependent RNA methyltransferase [Parvularculaceae bacterium]|nr:class I SAM-dependent RNA methyltransferase [Parvularculaceae bacterium]